MDCRVASVAARPTGGEFDASASTGIVRSDIRKQLKESHSFQHRPGPKFQDQAEGIANQHSIAIRIDDFHVVLFKLPREPVEITTIDRESQMIDLVLIMVVLSLKEAYPESVAYLHVCRVNLETLGLRLGDCSGGGHLWTSVGVTSHVDLGPERQRIESLSQNKIVARDFDVME